MSDPVANFSFESYEGDVESDIPLYAKGRFDHVIASYIRDVEATGGVPRKIPAIKVLREQTGLGLKAAKDAVENFGARNGYPTLKQMEPASVFFILLTTAVVVALAGLALALASMR
jgi:hypothetical protein